MKLQDVANQYLMHKFTFDEDSGNVLDSKGTAVGTVNGATRVSGFGGQGNAMSFDGVDDYVQFNQIVLPTSSFSIRFKIKVNELPSVNKTVLSTQNGSYLENGFRIQYRATGNLSVTIANGSSYVLSLMSTVTINDNNWHDILVTVKNNVVKMYIDDMNKFNVSGNIASSYTHSHNLRVGINGGVLDSKLYFKGQLDELEIYNEEIDGILQKKFVALKNNTSIYSLDNQTLIHLPSSSNKNMILHGLEAGKEVQLDVPFNKMKFVQDTSEVLGEGKVFTHDIDIGKIRAKKLIL